MDARRTAAWVLLVSPRPCYGRGSASRHTIHEPSRNQRHQGHKYLASGSVEGDREGQPIKSAIATSRPLRARNNVLLASLTARLLLAESDNATGSSQRDARRQKGICLGIRELWPSAQEPHPHAHPTHRDPARRTSLLGRAGMTGFVRLSLPVAPMIESESAGCGNGDKDHELSTPPPSPASLSVGLGIVCRSPTGCCVWSNHGYLGYR
jgi:hypothetical protein